MIFQALISNGKPLFDHRDKESLNKYFSIKEGKTLWFQIEDKRPIRTILQNNYYWGVVVQMISDEVGHTPEEIHEEMKNLYCPRFYKKYEDKEVQVPRSTTRLNSKEFSDYIERCRAFASTTLSVSIPDPQ